MRGALHEAAVQRADLPLDPRPERIQGLATTRVEVGERQQCKGVDPEDLGEGGDLLECRTLQSPLEGAHIGPAGDVRKILLREVLGATCLPKRFREGSIGGGRGGSHASYLATTTPKGLHSIGFISWRRGKDAVRSGREGGRTLFTVGVEGLCGMFLAGQALRPCLIASNTNLTRHAGAAGRTSRRGMTVQKESS